MASLQKYSVKGHEYYRIVESRRIKGKSRPIPILHIGTREELIQRLLNPSHGSKRIRSFQHGDVACLKAVADKLDVVGIIDRHVPRGRRAVSVGTSLLLAAVNRASRPSSKRAWSDWAKGTSVEKFFNVQSSQLTSQHFWDQMDEVSESALEAIESELTGKIISEFNIGLDTVFYDTTNYFTYIASTNERSTLTKRGRNKQKRSDLRQFGLGLLVSRDGDVPLCSNIYKGNVPDSKIFPESLTCIRKRMESLALALEDLTLVYDKGNNSKKNQALVDEGKIHYVASLVPTQHKDLLSISKDEYKPLSEGKLKDVPVYRCKKTIWGVERTLVMFISDRLLRGQIAGLQQHLSKCLEALEKWKETLTKPGSGAETAETAQKRIDEILSAQHMKDVLKVEYNPRRRGANRLSWKVDQEKISHLTAEVFGKRILMTDHHDWSSEEIVLAYRGQSKAESNFRQSKDPDHLAVRPQYHWTDQKVRVHTFVCLLALTLSRLLEREARRHGYRHCLSGLLDELATIRLALIMTVSTSKKLSLDCQWQLEEADPDSLALFQKLVPNREPFVYTAHDR
jgi:transposase